MAFVACIQPAWSASWDLAADWSNANNPNGVWTIGGYDPVSGIWTTWSTLCTDWLGNIGQSAWGFPGTPGLFKSVGGLWGVPVGRVGGHTMAPGSAYMAAKWTAPADMVVNIVGDAYTPFDPTNRPAAVGLYVKNVVVVDGVAIPDTATAANPFTLVAAGGGGALLNVSVLQGQTIILGVRSMPTEIGYAGPNAMDLTISQVPEPGALGVLSTGIISLFGLAVRRRRR